MTTNTSNMSVMSMSVTRVETIVQVVILLFMGGMAGAASFVHIHDVTVHHGQPSWIGWANAVVIELMSIVAGLDIRRRKRAGHSTGSVVVVLLVAVGISLAAQVATAQPSVWGWVVAALPALGLLAVVKIVLSRTAAITGPDPDRTPHTGRPGLADRSGDQVTDRPVVSFHPLLDPDAGPRPGLRPTAGHLTSTSHPVPGDDPARSVAVLTKTIDAQEPVRTVRTANASGPGPRPGPRIGRGTDATAAVGAVGADRLDEHVVGLGRTVATQLAAQDRPLTRSNLIEGIRSAGHTIGTDKASALLRRLKSPAEPLDHPSDSQPGPVEHTCRAQPEHLVPST
jgi:hypothetical protein